VLSVDHFFDFAPRGEDAKAQHQTRQRGPLAVASPGCPAGPLAGAFDVARFGSGPKGAEHQSPGSRSAPWERAATIRFKLRPYPRNANAVPQRGHAGSRWCQRHARRCGTGTGFRCERSSTTTAHLRIPTVRSAILGFVVHPLQGRSWPPLGAVGEKTRKTKTGASGWNGRDRGPSRLFPAGRLGEGQRAFCYPKGTAWTRCSLKMSCQLPTHLALA